MEMALELKYGNRGKMVAAFHCDKEST
jgi:hypothetical protein